MAYRKRRRECAGGDWVHRSDRQAARDEVEPGKLRGLEHADVGPEKCPSWRQKKHACASNRYGIPGDERSQDTSAKRVSHFTLPLQSEASVRWDV
jgi:hypothetical protein